VGGGGVAAARERKRTPKNLPRRRKGDAGKVAITRRLRAETTLTLTWIGGALRMGACAHVLNLLNAQRIAAIWPHPMNQYQCLGLTPSPALRREPCPRSAHDLRSLDHHPVSRCRSEGDGAARFAGHGDVHMLPVNPGQDQHLVSLQSGVSCIGESLTLRNAEPASTPQGAYEKFASVQPRNELELITYIKSPCIRAVGRHILCALAVGFRVWMTLISAI